MLRISARSFAGIAMCLGCALAQGTPQSQESAPRNGPVPVYRVTVVEHAIDAVNYQYGSAPTKVDFRGTVLLSNAKGEATVQSRRGHTEINAKFENLVAPTRFGREFLTYVLWALSPEGAPHNLGEVLPDASDHASLRVTTDLQAFAMIVTAEPYATVRQPSQVVTLENHVRPDTQGKIQPIRAKPELMRQGEYTLQLQEQPEPAANAPKVSMGRYEATVELYQAQNAVAIAQSANAEKYAPDAFAAAQRALGEAQRLQTSKGNSKLIVQNAREAAQHAEDARLIAERRKQEEQLAAAERAKEQAEAEAQRARAESDASRSQADRPSAPSTTRPAPPPAVTPPNQADRLAPESPFRARLLQRLTGAFVAHDTPRGLVITIPDNAFNGVNLMDSVSQKLRPIGSTLASQPAVRVDVQAFTDSSGSELQSWERAQAVRNALLASGLSPDQIAIRGMGAQANRRVELVVLEYR